MAPRTVSGTRKTGPVVLVIHSDSHARERMAADLAEAGFTVLEARDGAAGVEHVFRFGPRAIVVALALAGLDGLKVIRRLRTDERFHDLPILATGDAPRQATVAVAAGASAFLCEPCAADVLVESLAGLLSDRRAVRVG